MPPPRVELGALLAVVIQPAGVVHLHIAAGGGGVALALHNVQVLKARFGGDHE
jgi:hypothetical protein